MSKKFTKQLVYAAFAVVCIAAAGFFYLSEQTKRQDVVLEVIAPVLTEAPAAAPPTETNKIKVYIAGAVMAPGVYELDADSRVEDALKRAGGANEEADLLRVNLAARLKDGQQIVVPKYGEPVDKSLIQEENNSQDALININTADRDGLMKLPGVGDVTAGNIIQYREEHGDFKTIEDIQKVTRIGPKSFEKLKDLITVD